MFKQYLLSILFVVSGAAVCAQNGDFFLHTVERGQTVYSISRMYHVSENDVIRLNPGSETVIRDGQKLKIPQQSGSYVYHTIQPQETLYGVSKKYGMTGEDIMNVNPGLSVSTFLIGKIIRIPVNQVNTPINGDSEAVNTTNSLLNRIQPLKSVSPIKIALILPFDAKGKKDRRIVEYYEGFLLALKELKQKGVSVNLDVYDSGQGMTEIHSILKNSELKNVHLIIGGTSAQIPAISQFTRERDIPYVIPFTSDCDEPYYNPKIYQINTPQSYLYSKASLAFALKYRNENIFLVSNEEGNANKEDFISALKSDLQAQKVNFRTVSLSDVNLEKIELSPSKRNIFVPNDDTQNTLEKLIVMLKSIVEVSPEYSISPFGYTRWQIDAQKTMTDEFNKMNVIFFSGFYSNPLNEDVQTFYKTFYKWYGRPPVTAFPRYGILGYDTGMFFILAIDRYGASFENKIGSFKYNGIQTCFNFERVNNWGGFVNTGLYFVNYQSDFTIRQDVIN
ncbi:MAG: LysM peptidoglycan-binding domain-containing protein [Dysgonamonadaceae bacterium]|jgi:LysM repeat protein|nr:LysM peptidoglycan-binding domain-containing protein [Dysgonamonadaceae bacterium]